MNAPQVGDVITTVEGLNALPRGATVVIDDAEGSLVAVKDGRRWHTVGMDPLPSADLWDLSRDPAEGGPTPVVVVHLPGRLPRPERVVKAEALREVATSAAAQERARQLVEDELIEWRDSGLFELRNNGLAIKYRDGSPGGIRFGFEHGYRRALLAEADVVEAGEPL